MWVGVFLGMQDVLVLMFLLCYFNFVDCVGWVVGEVDVDKDIVWLFQIEQVVQDWCIIGFSGFLVNGGIDLEVIGLVYGY